MCDLNPQKTCRFTTKLVPKLTPKEECTVVPRETCHLSFSAPVAGKKPLVTKWCMDDDNDILLGLEQTGGPAVNTDADTGNSDLSGLGGALVPPVAGSASEISANVPTPYSSDGAATVPSRASSSRQPSSNSNDLFQQNGQSPGQRGADNAERKRPSVQGQTRFNSQGQGRPSNALLGKPSKNEQRKSTSNEVQRRLNKKQPTTAVQGRPSEGIKKRPGDQVRPVNAGQRRPGNRGKISEAQRKPTNLGKGKATKERPTKGRPTSVGQGALTKGGQQRPSDVAQLRTTNGGQRKPTTQGNERITNGRPNQEVQGPLSNAGQGIQNLGRPSYGNGGQGNQNTDKLLTSDPSSIQVEEAQPGYGTERPLIGNSKQPSFSVSVGELRPPPEVGGVNTVASQAPEAYLPPPSLDYPSSEDLNFGLPQDNPSYGLDSNEAIIGTHASDPRPLPGQLADLSDLPDLQDYYDQLPNSLQSYYDQAEDYYYDQYDEDLDFAAPVAPDTGYGSPGRRQTRRVDPLRRGWMSYQELLG